VVDVVFVAVFVVAVTGDRGVRRGVEGVMAGFLDRWVRVKVNLRIEPRSVIGRQGDPGLLRRADEPGPAGHPQG
jgi:hypothetical protein